MRIVFHMALHFVVPAIVCWCLFPKKRGRKWLIMMATMAVDLDHFLAWPIFDPNRCSIFFHPLHSWPAIFVYTTMTAFPKSRIAGIGLLIHMGLDLLDCVMMRCC